MIAFVRIRFPNKAMTGINSAHATREGRALDPKVHSACTHALLFDMDGVLIDSTPRSGRRACRNPGGKGAGARVIAFRTTASLAELQKVDPNWIIENCSSIALRSVTGKLQMELRD